MTILPQRSRLSTIISAGSARAQSARPEIKAPVLAAQKPPKKGQSNPLTSGIAAHFVRSAHIS
jgi:hypothetical protein